MSLLTHFNNLRLTKKKKIEKIKISEFVYHNKNNNLINNNNNNNNKNNNKKIKKLNLIKNLGLKNLKK